MTAIVAFSGFAVAFVVWLVERAAAKQDAREAHRAGFLKGYRAATLYQGHGYEE